MKVKKISYTVKPHQEIAFAIDRLLTNFKKHNSNQHTKRREVISEGLISLGNLSFAALFFGHAFGGIKFDFTRAAVGLMSLIISYYVVYLTLKEKRAD